MTDLATRHPAGLKVLFFAEMWERLSYYGMRGLLVLYLTKVFNFDDKSAYILYGSYTALVYATPVLGGYFADRVLGCRKAVILGGVLMVLGHAVMTIQNIQMVYLALALIIIGNGFFKPNISTIVGLLYKPGDSMRDAGFTIFYMGINLGAFLQLIAGVLGERVGWHYGFGFAGVGMVLGLIVFWKGQGLLHGHADPPDPEKLRASFIGGITNEWAIYIGSAIAVGIAWFLVQRGEVVGTGMNVFGALVGVGLICYAIFACNSDERSKMFAALIMIFASIAFWACFEQAGSSMNLFTDRNVDRSFFGYEIPTTAFQSVNPLFIILFAIPLSKLWVKLAAAGKEPSTPLKFRLGYFPIGPGLRRPLPGHHRRRR